MAGLYKKAGGTFIFKILGLSIAFILQIVLGRILNPKLYGIYTMYITYTTLFSIITIIGMDRNLIKEIPRLDIKNNKGEKLLKFSIKVSFIIMFLIIFVIFIMKKSLKLSNDGFLILTIMVGIKTIIVLLDGYLQGKEQILKVTFLNTLLNNIFKIIIFLIFVFLGIKELNSAIISFILGEFLTILIRLKIISIIIKSESKEKYILEKFEKKLFIKYSITMALISGIGIILQNVDKIVISYYLDFVNVGIYKVSQNYVSLISVFITPFVAFWPIISKLYNENRLEQIEVEMKTIIRLITYLVIPMFYIFIFKGNILLKIFGDEYVTKQAYVTLIILSSAFLIDAISGPIGSILIMTKYARYSLINNIIALIINFSLNILLVRKMGIIGVSVATAISIICNNLISIIQVKVLLGIFSYDIKYLIQIICLVFLNFIFSGILFNLIDINNLYLNITIFGTLIYILNILIIFFVERKNINKILKIGV